MRRTALPGPHVQKHGLLEYTGRCYACGEDVSAKARAEGEPRYYCSYRCLWARPPKQVLAEEAWGKPFAEMALEHLRRGGTVVALADMCGVQKQTVYTWLRRAGIRRETRWVQKGAGS